jgi:S-adenosylmethionine hydrolase
MITVYLENGDTKQVKDIYNIKEQIQKEFRGLEVSNVCIDEEFGNVWATVDGMKYVDCGNIEYYQKL